MNFRLRLSFTERRRRMLAKKVDRLDRLEARTTITEPISFTGLSISALRGLVQLGLMSPYGGSNAPSPFVRAKDIEKQAGRAVPKPYAIPAKLLKSIDALALSQHAGGGAGSAAASSTASSSAAHNSDSSNDWLTLNAKPSADAASTGISKPWHPAKGAGGGAARAPRGGTSASRGITPAGRGAITPLRLPSNSASASTGGGASAALLAAVAGASSVDTQPGVAGALPVPKISLVHAGAGAASGASNQGGGVTLSADADPGPTPSGGSTPLPGSTPDLVTGNASPMTEGDDVSEPFQVYVLDNQAGVVLYPGVDQLATLDGWMDLKAQVQGATVSSYSWSTSGMPVTSVSGSSTDQLNFRWDNSNESSSGYVTSLTLSVTDTSSQTLTYTYDFWFPPGSVGGDFRRRHGRHLGNIAGAQPAA